MNFNLGINSAYFKENIFEKDIFHKKKCLENDEFGWSDVNDLIKSIQPGAPDLILYKSGIVPEKQYIERYTELGVAKKRIRKRNFYSLLSEGATVLMNRIDIKSIFIKRLCLEISRMVGAQSFAKGFLAFGGTGSYGNHWDIHDVFVIQLVGRKQWTVYKPTFELPLSSQSSLGKVYESLEEPVFNEVLEAGDILYIPRGWWHCATPINNQETFHIGVEIVPPQVIDYIRWIIGNTLPNHIECRRSITYENASLIDAAKIMHDAILNENNLELFRQQVVMLERSNTSFSVEKYINKNISDDCHFTSSYSQMVFSDNNKVQAGGEEFELSLFQFQLLKYISENRVIGTKRLKQYFDHNTDIINDLHHLLWNDLIELIN